MKKKLVQRQHMTMIEVLISLVLIMFLLSALTWFYRDIDNLNTHLEQLEQENFKLRYLSNRLMAVLPASVSEKDPKGDFYFFTASANAEFFKAGSQSLIFTYDAGTIDQLFSNHALGRLFLDPQGKLILITWPSPNRWIEGDLPPYKQEVLMDNVENVSFEFFVAPDKEWQGLSVKGPQVPQSSDAIAPTPQREWIPVWRPEFKQLPAMIRLFITRKGSNDPDIFIYPLPNSSRQVVYTQ